MYSSHRLGTRSDGDDYIEMVYGCRYNVARDVPPNVPRVVGRNVNKADVMGGLANKASLVCFCELKPPSALDEHFAYLSV